MSVFRSKSNNPFVNLAVESWLFSTPKDPDEYVLYLWRNGPSVIIGKHQSAWRECNVQKMESEKINLVRRSSGGGAVFQDLGNSIFSFLSPKSDSKSIQRNNNILIDALKTGYNIDAVATGRNDIHVDGRKVSGAAFKNTKDRSLHHGTLLLNVNMNALGNYLTPNKLKLQSKGVASVEAHVLNLVTKVPRITHEGVGEAITASFFREHQTTCSIIDIEESAILKQEEHVRSVVAQLQDWDWRFGSKNPEFTHQIETRFAWGTFDVNLLVQNGVISRATIYCDVLDVLLVDAISAALTNVKYDVQHVTKALQTVRSSYSQANEEHLIEFTSWIASKL